MKTLNKIFAIIILLSSLNLTAQGLNFSTAEDLAGVSEAPQDYGFAGDLPARYSLERYVPPVMTQRGGTCVGFSSLYYGLSTMYNIQFNITNWRDKLAHSFDPYFIYSLMKSNVNNCDSGLNMASAFNNLIDLGTKKMFLTPFLKCDETWTEDKFVSIAPLTMPYRINTWYWWDTDNPNLDLSYIAKLQIANGTPVIVGMDYVKSMGTYSSGSTYGVTDEGLWMPSPNESVDGGHAMCVVGYDDNKFGGAIRIVNSWGTDYGDRGYLWVKYSDFNKFTKEIFIMELNENVTSNRTLKSGIKDDDYRRYGYNNNGKVSTYEGQYINNSINGYGIWHNTSNDTHYAGFFNDGNMQGYFIVFDEDGMWSTYARNGKLEDWSKLGFAGDDDENIIETQMSAESYFDMLDIGFNGIRQANSTSGVQGGKD